MYKRCRGTREDEKEGGIGGHCHYRNRYHTKMRDPLRIVLEPGRMREDVWVVEVPSRTKYCLVRRRQSRTTRKTRDDFVCAQEEKDQRPARQLQAQRVSSYQDILEAVREVSVSIELILSTY